MFCILQRRFCFYKKTFLCLSVLSVTPTALASLNYTSAAYLALSKTLGECAAQATPLEMETSPNSWDEYLTMTYAKEVAISAVRATRLTTPRLQELENPEWGEEAAFATAQDMFINQFQGDPRGSWFRKKTKTKIPPNSSINAIALAERARFMESGGVDEYLVSFTKKFGIEWNPN